MTITTTGFDSDEHKLDAYGHLNWTVNAAEEQPDGSSGEWMACFDAIYNEVANTIDYHVVVDGGSFVDTIEQGSIPAWDKDKVAGLKQLPDYWYDIGLEHGLLMDEQGLQDTRYRWGALIDVLLKQGLDQEEMAAVIEQSPDYFNRYIAGDR